MNINYEKDIHPFLKDKEGRYRTLSLFLETNLIQGRRNTYQPLFTLKGYDYEFKGKPLPSLKLIYLSYDHVPGYEYDFAMDVFGSWEHWLKLYNAKLLQEHIDAWRQEMEVKLAAKGMKAMMKASQNPEKGIAAAKYLADRGWKPTKGRPSKEEVERERKIAAGIQAELEDDMERIGLTLVAGGK